MKHFLFRLYAYFTNVVVFPLVARDLLRRSCGKEYGITTIQKLRLLRQIKCNVSSVVSATGWNEHLLLVTRVLSLPADLDGDVIECGCFKGASTSSLSLACHMTGRRLIVCDSFEGLPPIADHDVVHVSEAAGRFETYSAGEYAGSMEEVRSNVDKYGNLAACDFVKGYFEHTLPALDRRAVMVFLDVDLHESLKTCIVNLWPKVCDYGYVYTHEAQQLDYVALFFDREFWMTNFGVKQPGLIGAGSGLPYGISESCGLGYTRKLPVAPTRDDDPRLLHFCGDPSKN
jgi:O-methyltransferase